MIGRRFVWANASAMLHDVQEAAGDWDKLDDI